MAKNIKKIAYLVIIPSIAIAMTKTIIFLPWQKTKYQSHYDNIVVFGDSLSDSSTHQINYGNNDWVIAQGSDVVGAPITSINSQGQRDTWLNYLIDDRYFSSQTLYNRYQQKPNSYSGNISYAVASAQSGGGYTDDLSPVPWRKSQNCYNGNGNYGSYSCVANLRQQVNDYLSDVDYKPNLHTLYIIWIGGNDLYQNIAKMMTHSNEPLSHPILNITKSVNALIKSGVKPQQIIILNLPNFSMVPAIHSLVANGIENSIMQNTALKAISYFSDGFNALLSYSLIYGTGFQLSDNQIYPIDQLFLSVYHDPDIQKDIGITHELNTPCLSEHPNGDCKGYLFYNEMHPTTEVHQYLAQKLKQYIFLP